MSTSNQAFRTRTRHRIVILGGTGFIGSHLVDRLVRDGHRIKVLTRRREQHRHLLVYPTVDVETVDVFSKDALVKIFERADTVINLVGILNESGHNGRGFRQAHVDFTQRAADAAHDAGVSRFLQMSALGAGANGPSHYLRTKGEAENLLMTHAARYMSVTIFKPSVIFGEGDSFVNRFAGLLKMLPVLPLACPQARFSPVFVGDVCEAFARSLDDSSTIGQRIELCGPDTYSLLDIVRFIRAELGIRRFILPLPNWLAKLQAMIMEFVPGKPLSVDNYNSLKLDSVCNGNGLKSLGIHATSLRAIAPYYLSTATPRRRYDDFRRAARNRR